MSESEAYDVAVALLKKLGATYYRCYSKGFDRDHELNPLLLDPDFPRGCRNVWSFAFTMVEEEPDVIVSGGDCVIYVDDDTSICQVMHGL
jgi:hypothetical protein